MGKTGIEIKVGLTGGQHMIGKVLHALHLEKLVELVAKVSTAHIKVDGREPILEPLYEAHFIELAPGPHHVEMHIQSGVPSPTSVAKLVYGAKLDANVEAGKVTVLMYTPKDGVGASLKLEGTRDT